MLTLVLGDFGTGKTTRLTQEIISLTGKGSPSFLVVPEQATVTTERALSAVLPPSAPLCFEVSNFSRLANTAFRRLGGLVCPPVSKEDKPLLMWRSLRECKHMLSGAVNPDDAGQIRRFVAACDEMRMKGVTADGLLQARDALQDDRTLQRKLSDLLLAGDCYRMLLSQQHAHGDEDVTRLAHMLESTELFSETAFFFDGFVSFTAEELAVLRGLVRKTDVTVALAIPPVPRPPLAYTEVRETALTLQKMAADCGADFHVEKQEFRHRPQAPVLSYVADRLFSASPAKPYQGQAQGTPIGIMSLPDMFAEADYIAGQVARLVRQGMRYRDILLVGGDPAAYRGILDAALERYGIPYYFAEKKDMTAYEPVKLILALYRMRHRGFRTDDVITYLKCGFAGISRADCDAMERYAATWHLRGSAFTDGKPFSLRPVGYTDRPATEAEQELLERLNAVKQTLMRPLALLGGAPANRTVRAHGEALVLFLEELAVEKQLRSRADVAAAAGRRVAAADYLSLYPAICAVLDRIVTLLGDVTVSEEEFASLLALTFDGMSIGQIPSAYDQVVIGDADMLRPTAPRCTVMFGVTEGIFPHVPQEKSYFSEGERRRLAALGLTLQSERLSDSARGHYNFLRAFLSPPEQLLLTVPRVDRGLTPLTPASVLREIFRLGGAAVSFQKAEELTALDRLWTRRAALRVLADLRNTPDYTVLAELISEDESLRRCVERVNLPPVQPTCRVSPRPGGADAAPLFLTQGHLESFVKCPFSYTCNHLLHLREDAVGEFRSTETGRFAHGVIEQFFALLRETGKHPRELSPHDCQCMTEAAAGRYMATMFQGGRPHTRRLEHLCRRLTAAALPVLDSIAAELAHSDFEPLYFELPVSRRCRNETDDFRLSDGTPLALSGQIDRVDGCHIGDRQYLRVIDYKTGAKVFDPDNAAKGLDLQMLLYLSMLCDRGETGYRRSIGLDDVVYPAGILYTPAGQKDLLRLPTVSRDLRTDSRGSLMRTGVLLSSEDVLHAMSHDPVAAGWGSHDQKGVFKYNKGLYLQSEEELSQTLQQLRKTVVSIGDAIQSGESSATPLKQGTGRGDSCTYCPYKPICRNTQSGTVAPRTQ